MYRSEQRWRAQRSAISIVGCITLWADSDLNAHCAFSKSLEARLLQCLLSLPARRFNLGVGRATACRASGLCALLQRCFALARKRRSIAELRCDSQLPELRGYSNSCAGSSVSSVGSLPTRCCDPDTLCTSAVDRDMELGLPTSWM